MKQTLEIPEAGYMHCDPCFCFCFSFNCFGLQTFDLIFPNLRCIVIISRYIMNNPSDYHNIGKEQPVSVIRLVVTPSCKIKKLPTM